MDTDTGVIAALALFAVRLVYQWAVLCTQVRLTEVRQRHISERVRALPTGSELTEQHRGDDIRVVIGGGRRHR